MRSFWVLSASIACCACGGDESHPPEFHPDSALSAPRKCDEVRQGEVQGNAIWVQGEPAGCAAEGLACPVYDLAAFAGVCAKGTPGASCVSGKWKVLCDLDAGIGDAPDGTSDGGSADASAE